MYKSQLDSLLKQSAPRASLLYGNDFFVAHYGKVIAKCLNIEEKHTFYFDEYDKEHINTLLLQNSLFGANSLIVLKINHKISKADIELFLHSLSNNTHNALIIEYYYNSSKSQADYAKDCKTLAGYFKNPKFEKNELVEVRFFEPTMQECMTLMREKSKALALRADDKILSQILLLQNNDIAISLNELEKFVVYANGKNIEPNDVNLLCDGVASFSIMELCYTLMDKKPFIKMLHNIYEDGTNEMAMIAEIQRFFYQLFLFYAFMRINGKPDAKQILGYSPPIHIAESLSRYAMKLKENEYIAIFELLSAWRYEVSKGKSKHSMSVLIKIQEMIR